MGPRLLLRTVTPTATSEVPLPVPILNPNFVKWQERDQKAILIIQSSLTEEAIAEVLGLSTTMDVWTALEKAYHHDSIE